MTWFPTNSIHHQPSHLHAVNVSPFVTWYQHLHHNTDFLQIYTWELHWQLSDNYNFHYNQTKIMDTLHDYLVHFCNIKHISCINFQTLIRVKFYCTESKQKWNTHHILHPTNHYTADLLIHRYVHGGFTYLQNSLVLQCRCHTHSQLLLLTDMEWYASSSISPPVLYDMECTYHLLFTISGTNVALKS